MIQLDEHGRPVWDHSIESFRVPLADHTLGPRDAAVVQYTWTVPELAPTQRPLSIEARLRHRRHPTVFSREVCKDAQRERSQAFAQAALAMGHGVIDPCVPQPITEIAAVKVTMGHASARPAWRRRYDHAVGWLHNVQERIGEVRPSLEAALAQVEALGDVRGQAMVWSLLGSLNAKQGRTEEALAALTQAAALAPGEPAPAFLRGEALSKVWRWCEAAEAYREALRLSPPGDDRVHVGLARALGSCGEDDQAALDAARAGLERRPRNAALLLSQALALGRLGAPEALVREAREAYLKYRPEDNVTPFTLACARAVEGCENWRRPVPRYALEGADE